MCGDSTNGSEFVECGNDCNFKVHKRCRKLIGELERVRKAVGSNFV